jgi:hypothetical protein
MRQDWIALGPLAYVPDLWRNTLLRFVAQQARKQTRQNERSPRYCIGRTERALVILLSGRGLRGVLTA